MNKKYFDDIYTGPWVVTGNTAKVKVLHELSKLFSEHDDLQVLDIGCIGLQPFRFWEPLLGRYRFNVIGTDVQDVEMAKKKLIEHGWTNQVSLKQISGYDLDKVFPANTFDIVIATQVLEHVPRLPLFMRQVARVLKPGGDVFFTVDSAHYLSRFSLGDPLRLLKNIVKKSLSLLGYERHYDLPWFDHEVMGVSRSTGLELVSCRYYNLMPLKSLHNHFVPDGYKNQLMQNWFDLEESLNEFAGSKGRHFFMGLYFHFHKP